MNTARRIETKVSQKAILVRGNVQLKTISLSSSKCVKYKEQAEFPLKGPLR